MRLSVKWATAWLACLLLTAGCDSLQPQATQTEDADGAAGEASAAETPPPAAAASDAAPATAAATPSSTPDPAAGSPDGKKPATVDPAAVQAEASEFQQRLFGGLAVDPAATPDQLLGMLQRIDAAIQDLMVASANNIIDEAIFRDSGLRLGKMKFQAAEQLTAAPAASDDQRKAGQLAQLVALSHLSGFRDVESAQRLEKFAAELAESPDADLAHQSRVVLMGFQLQALQNGLVSEPDELLAQAKGLFTRPEDRNFPELMMLLQASQVLNQMGFSDAAKQVDALLVAEYRDSSDPQLRAEAWNVETRGSQALDNYLNAFRSLGTEAFDSVAALAAARGLLEAFPSTQTLEQLAGTITNIEYGGQLALSQQLAELIRQYAERIGPTAPVEAVESVLAGHEARFALLDKPLALDGIVGFDDQPFAWSDYAGKVVLVDFWATWCMPCLQEIPNMRAVYQDLQKEGFEVISINMDENLPAAKTFVEKQAFPWRTFRASDRERLGFKSAFAKQFGVSAIPFMLLIDRDGLVTAIHVRGDKLAPKVRQLLGLESSLIPAE